MAEEEGWITVASAGAVAPGDIANARVGNADIAIFNVDGSFYATDNVCTHAFALLSDGWLDGDTVVGPQNTVALAHRLREHGVAVTERHFPRFTHPSTLLELGSLLTRRSSLAGEVAAFLESTVRLATPDGGAMIGRRKEGAGR